MPDRGTSLGINLMSGVDGQPLPDLLCKAVDVLVAADVKPGRDFDQIGNIGDQRIVETRLRLIEPVDDMGCNLAHPRPEVFGSPSHQGSRAVLWLKADNYPR